MAKSHVTKRKLDKVSKKEHRNPLTNGSWETSYLVNPHSRTKNKINISEEPLWKLNPQYVGSDFVNVVFKVVYPADLNLDIDDRYVVTFPDFPEALTDGEGIEEAKEEAIDCLAEAIAGRINRNEDLPVPSTTEHNIVVAPPVHIAIKALLYTVVRNSGIPKTEIAKQLKCDEKEIRRLLDPRHPSKLPRMEALLSLFGKRLVVSLENT